LNAFAVKPTKFWTENAARNYFPNRAMSPVSGINAK